MVGVTLFSADWVWTGELSWALADPVVLEGRDADGCGCGCGCEWCDKVDDGDCACCCCAHKGRLGKVGVVLLEDEAVASVFALFASMKGVPSILDKNEYSRFVADEPNP